MEAAIAGVIEELLDTTAGRLEDVAREAGVSYSALYSWATGRRRPSRESLERLAGIASKRARKLSRIAGKLERRSRRKAEQEEQEEEKEEQVGG